MSIYVEFYGVVRQRAGVAQVEVPGDGPMSLAAALAALGERFPTLEGECFERGAMCSGFLCNVDGQRFVVDPETTLDGDCSLLIMSADAGG
jgi:molybdopterin converting factor small subunit